jgi:hypothetical protein
MSANMNDKVKAIAKVSVPSSTPQPHAPRQQTGASPGGSNAMGGRVRPSATVSPPIGPIVGPAITGSKPINKSPDSYLGQTAGANTGSHISDPIRAALEKHPEQAAEIRRVAGSK